MNDPESLLVRWDIPNAKMETQQTLNYYVCIREEERERIFCRKKKQNKNEFLSKLHKSKHCALKLQISLKIFEVDAPLLLLVNCFYLRHNTRVALDLGKVCDYHIHKECNVTCNQSRALPSSYSTWRVKLLGFAGTNANSLK